MTLNVVYIYISSRESKTICPRAYTFAHIYSVYSPVITTANDNCYLHCTQPPAPPPLFSIFYFL